MSELTNIQKALQNRYPHIHPLIFKRTIEKASSDGEIFDILETFPKMMPVSWCEEKRCWIIVDLFEP